MRSLKAPLAHVEPSEAARWAIGEDDMKAIWNGAVLAESDETVVVEGNHYFPREAIDDRYFRPSENHTVCHWKGTADYLHVDVDGRSNPNAAWFYPTPSAAAAQITGHVAFWHGVEVVED